MAKKSGELENKRLAAFKDYMAGVQPRDIAKKYAVQIRTVRGWSEREGWPARRKAAFEAAQNAIFNRLQKRVCEATESFLELAVVGSKVALESVKAIAEGGDTLDVLDQAAELEKWVDIALKLSKIQRAVLPQASEELSRLIYEELKRLGQLGLFKEQEQK